MPLYRVMVEEETGEESCHGNNLEGQKACDLAVKLKEDHEEWRHVWVELEKSSTVSNWD